MYVPRLSAVQDEDEIRAMVAAMRRAWLITVGRHAMPVATLMPIMWRGDIVIAHMAKANSHWRQIEDDFPALLIVRAEAYISPSWYAAKTEHGKVVPTWHYAAAHLTGTVRVSEDPEWLRRAITTLTDLHENGRKSWQVSDAPDRNVDGFLRGIVGIEVKVNSVEAKAKFSHRPRGGRRWTARRDVSRIQADRGHDDGREPAVCVAGPCHAVNHHTSRRCRDHPSMTISLSTRSPRRQTPRIVGGWPEPARRRTLQTAPAQLKQPRAGQKIR